MDCKGIIFDMDGTLLDSMKMWRSLGTIFLRAHGFEPPEPQFDRKIYAMSISQMQTFFEQEYGLHYANEYDFHTSYYQTVEPYYRETIAPKPGALAFLRALKAAGIRCCIATATRTQVAMPALERLGMMDLVEFVICCDDVGANKHFPEIYLRAASKMGLSMDEIVVFEDALYCVRTAKQAGFRVVGVADASARAEADEIRSLCDRYIESYGELLSVCDFMGNVNKSPSFVDAKGV